MKRLLPRCLTFFATIAFVACQGTLTPSRQNPRQYTAFDAVVEGCDLASVKQMLASDRKLVNEKGWSDTTPLYLAALNNCTEVAAYLMAKGANVNAASKEGAVPLHIAAQKGNLPLVKLLLARGADPTARDSKGRTPADRALMWHYPEIAAYIQHHTARPSDSRR